MAANKTPGSTRRPRRKARGKPTQKHAARDFKMLRAKRDRVLEEKKWAVVVDEFAEPKAKDLFTFRCVDGDLVEDRVPEHGDLSDAGDVDRVMIDAVVRERGKKRTRVSFPSADVPDMWIPNDVFCVIYRRRLVGAAAPARRVNTEK